MLNRALITNEEIEVIFKKPTSRQLDKDERPDVIDKHKGPTATGMHQISH